MGRRPARIKHLLVSESPAMKRVVTALDNMAESGRPVIVIGERGTGRELVARILHASSNRSDGRFVVASAGPVATELSDPTDCTSSATLEAARGGTLLIKELCDLPQLCQRKLAHLLRERPRDGERTIRVVGSSEDALSYAVEAGVFSRGLYELLSHCRIVVPPLRERLEDIPILITAFLRQYGARDSSRPADIVISRARSTAAIPVARQCGRVKGNRTSFGVAGAFVTNRRRRSRCDTAHGRGARSARRHVVRRHGAEQSVIVSSACRGLLRKQPARGRDRSRRAPNASHRDGTHRWQSTAGRRDSRPQPQHLAQKTIRSWFARTHESQSASDSGVEIKSARPATC